MPFVHQVQIPTMMEPVLSSGMFGESIFMDKWQGQYPPTHNRKRYNQYLFSSYDIDTSLLTQPERSTIDKWTGQYPDIHNRKRYLGYLFPFFNIDALQLSLPERSQVDKWLGSYPEIHNSKRYPRYLFPYLDTDSRRLLDIEVNRVDKWLPQAPDYHNRKRSVQYLFPFFQNDQAPVSTAIFAALDKWIGQAPDLHNRKRFMQALFPSLAIDTALLTQPERVQIDKWLGEYPHVHNKRRYTQALFPSFTRDENPVAASVFAQLDKWLGQAPDLHNPNHKVQYLFEHYSSDARQLTQPERVQLDKWSGAWPDQVARRRPYYDLTTNAIDTKQISQSVIMDWLSGYGDMPIRRKPAVQIDTTLRDPRPIVQSLVTDWLAHYSDILFTKKKSIQIDTSVRDQRIIVQSIITDWITDYVDIMFTRKKSIQIDTTVRDPRMVSQPTVTDWITDYLDLVPRKKPSVRIDTNVVDPRLLLLQEQTRLDKWFAPTAVPLREKPDWTWLYPHYTDDSLLWEIPNTRFTGSLEQLLVNYENRELRIAPEVRSLVISPPTRLNTTGASTIGTLSRSTLIYMVDFALWSTGHTGGLLHERPQDWSITEDQVPDYDSSGNVLFAVSTFSPPGSLLSIRGIDFNTGGDPGDDVLDYRLTGYAEALFISQTWPNTAYRSARVSLVFRTLLPDSTDGRTLSGPALALRGLYSSNTVEGVAVIYERSPHTTDPLVPLVDRVAIVHFHGDHIMDVLASVNMSVTSGQVISIEHNQVTRKITAYVNFVQVLQVDDSTANISLGRFGLFSYFDGTFPVQSTVSWNQFFVELVRL